MPRKARESLESNYIHLIVQGINKEYIFEKNEWKKEYIKIIKNKIENTDIKILSYCIMDNHAHFLMYYTELKELSNFMKRINTTYAMRYNRENERIGFVFRDRFFSQPILDKKQLYNCLVYIHQNPIRAGKCLNMEDYRFSSYSEYTNKRFLITEDSIKILFEREYKYLEQFNKIHQELKLIKTKKDVVNYGNYKIEEFIKKYETEIKVNFKENEIEFGKLLLEIKQKFGISLRKMSNIFNISKDKLNKYIHKIIDNQ